MAYVEWKGNRHDLPAVFELFFRKTPFKGNFAIMSGLDEAVQFLQNYKFSDDHISFLKQTLPEMDSAFFDWLKDLDCKKISIHGIQDGQIVLANEPMLTIEGPLALLQMIETPLLVLTNFSTLIRTNAARMKLRAGIKCVDFGMRRAQGPNGAMTATKYAVLGGFEESSNVYASYLYGTISTGTIAHSIIMSYEKEEDIQHQRILDGVDLLPKCLEVRVKLGWTSTNLGELYAFIACAQAYPNSFVALVDSYSTMNSGVKNFIILAFVLQELGYNARAIRLDSGDLAQLSIDCKKIIRETGEKFGYDFSKIAVAASNDINEKVIEELNAKGHQMDGFGIGTNLVTCQAQPALGCVYKIVEFQGTPRMKFSEEIEKATLPGRKAVIRVYQDNDAPSYDLLCLESEVEELLKVKKLQIYQGREADQDPSEAEIFKMVLKTKPIFVDG